MAKSPASPPNRPAKSPPIAVHLGPARSGKTHELTRIYRDTLRQAGPVASRDIGLDRTLWLAPNAPAAALVRGQLLDDGVNACLRPGVVTFDELTRLIVADARQASSVAPRPLDPFLARELLRRVVAAALNKTQLTFFTEAARRAGFIELLAEHILELKRRDISPAEYARVGPHRGDPQQHAELAQLYAAYEEQLTAHGLTDPESAQAAARDALAAGTSRRFAALEMIVVDGFTDFTRIQLDILRLLAQHTNHVHISLPADLSDPAHLRTGRLSDQSIGRDDLFAKVSATLAELRRTFPKLEVQHTSPRPSDWPAIDHLAQHIFSHPAHLPALPSAARESLDRVEIVAAAGVQDEIVQIARRIKRLLTEAKAKPGDVVVVFRSLTDVAPRVREVFTQFGIPFYLDARRPVMTAPLTKALLDVLRLEDERWPFRRVVSVLTNNSLTAIEGPARQAADWLARDLQIVEGRRALNERVEELAAQGNEPGPRSEHAERRVQAAAAALGAFRLLSNALSELPEEASPTEWRDSLANLATQLGLSPFAVWDGAPRTGRLSDQSEAAHASEFVDGASDALAWQSIATRLAALERLNAWLGEPQRTLTRREVISFLIDVATNDSLPRSHDEVGRVRVYAAPQARTVNARHLLLAGMSEQSFPLPERAGRLSSEADYRFFSRAADQQRAAKSQLAPPPSRAQEEMLLFYELVSRAEESLTISYPALDSKAQDLPPSPYVAEIERVIGADNAARVRRAAPQLSPVPQDHKPRSRADWRVRAIAEALDGNRRLLAGLFADDRSRPLGAAIDAGLRILHARARGESFGPAEGLLTSPAVAARLAERFGPAHYWSPSQWETYAACPYKFFLEDVLGLEPLGDLALETDFARRGSRLHHVLATFHRGWPQVRGDAPLTADAEAALFLDHLKTVIGERLAAAPHGGIDAALLELDRRQIAKWAAKHFEHHQHYAGKYAMTPAHLEFRFGPARPGDAEHDPNSVKDAFVLKIGDEQIRVTGQIDRIDVGTRGGKKVFNVIDYKSGKKQSLKPADIESGMRLQLPIYVEAAQALIFGGDASPLAAAYWSMDGGFDAKGALAVEHEDGADRWTKTLDNVHELVREFVGGIRRGDYPVASRDDQCTSYCDFHTICRISQVRSLGKTRPPACGLADDTTTNPGDPLGRG